MEVNGDQISAIRDKARYIGQANRAKKRSELRAAHRFDLSRVAEDIQIPDLDEIYKLSIQLKRKKSLETLHRLRMGLSVGGDSIEVFLSTQGALYALVGCLTGTSAEMKSEALNIAINLGLGTVEQCAKIFMKCPIYLMFGLTSNIAETQDATAWCIGNLCLHNAEICENMNKFGHTSHLHVLLKSRVPRVFQSASYALTHYYATSPERLRVGDVSIKDYFPNDCTDTIQVLVRKLIDGLENFNEATAEVGWLMFVISSNQVACEHMLCQGVIPTALCVLQKMINQQNLEVNPTTAILRVLLNCIGASPRSATQVCKRSDQFVSICKALLYSPHPHLRTETLQFIANVFNGACQSSSGQQLVLELNLRAKLDSAVCSALASSFTLKSAEISTNFYTL